jgi:small-conductance mechanosensitive channel
MNEDTRLNEWFVPKFGPPRFRVFIGLLFLPYTGMCISFTIVGSMLSSSIVWERAVAIAIIYALALGISAHTADSLGSKKVKPWGNYFNKKQLWLLIMSSLVAAYSIGIYYMILYVPLLWIVAILEGFFVFAYNFELFKGYFHNDFWFAVSWGVLAVMAGFIMQTNSIGVIPLAVSVIAGIISYVEIKISRPYKELKKITYDEYRIKSLETCLKIISLGTIAFATISIIYRLIV